MRVRTSASATHHARDSKAAACSAACRLALAAAPGRCAVRCNSCMCASLALGGSALSCCSQIASTLTASVAHVAIACDTSNDLIMRVRMRGQ
jgi:hypothetical protein